jgi:hypothetical protein
MQILPYIHLIDNDADAGKHYRISLALTTWSYESTEWMDNASMPEGYVMRPSIDIVLLARNFQHYPVAVVFMKKLMEFCVFLDDNGIKTLPAVQEHLETRFGV